MKVEGPQKSQSSSKAKKKNKAASGSGSFGDHLVEGSQNTQNTSTTQSIATVDALLAAQQSEDPASRAAKKRMISRAGSLLDELDKIKVALLTGSLTVGHVINIADVVASHRESVIDPKLTAILDEIDLRAQIEMAKLRMAMDNP